MSEPMRLAFKYKLRPTRKQEQAFRNFSGCCRFAYNALLVKEKEDYQEYLEELESRRCFGWIFHRKGSGNLQQRIR